MELFAIIFNGWKPLISFYFPWKHHKDQRFSDFFRAYKTRSVTWNDKIWLLWYNFSLIFISACKKNYIMKTHEIYALRLKHFKLLTTTGIISAAIYRIHRILNEHVTFARWGWRHCGVVSYKCDKRDNNVQIKKVRQNIYRRGSRAAATSKMECFVIIVNGWKPLNIITKHSILDVAVALDPPMHLYFLFCWQDQELVENQFRRLSENQVSK